MKKLSSLAFLSCLFVLCCCSKSPEKTTPPVKEENLTANFAKGADVSWLTEMETAGVKFYNNSGQQQDLLQVLKDKGINSIRLRVWVNPADGWCSTEDMVNKALRAKTMGFRIMLDIHYSDWWADPGKQTKPAAWAAYDLAMLKTTIFSYTVSVMNVLKNKSITPEWVQIGNETNDGMLWEDGRASVNMKNFADMVQQGYEAVKSVSSTSKVIVHISNGYDNTLFRWMFDGLKSNGANWDVIGMSLYPTSSNWQALNTQCLANMNDMVARYGKQVMICEVGMPATEAGAAKSFLTDIITKTNSVAGGKGLGVFYWEPQAYNSWKGYKLGAFDDLGKPTAAMDAFLME
ncbi:MAG: glycosyl hydrolase 53 family protein [Mucilaginibacter sp.]